MTLELETSEACYKRMPRAVSFALICALTAFASDSAAAPPPTAGSSVADARPRSGNDKDPRLIAKAEVLLDRVHFSSGEIDGFDGDNFRNAIRAFQQVNGLPVSGNLDAPTWSALTTKDSAPVLKAYTISLADVSGPFTRAIPTNLVAMARLSGLSYTSAQAELAEKFHMSQSLLRQLNPRADFARAGTEITVASVPEMNLRSGRRSVEVVPPQNAPKASNDPPGVTIADPPGVTIAIDKPARNLRVYDRDGKFLAFYPATIGSEEKPAPSGDFKVKGIIWNPDYQYDPKFAWKGVNAKRKLTVGPGPNNPVGLVWIDLTDPSYGIHGTPAPADIGKTQSHGCIRLTNWDAVALAAMVRPDVVVRFEDQDTPVWPLATPLSQWQEPDAKGHVP
jgi:lipoprotein-anchoring transpeptidase ErfK/SrfK